MCVPGSIRTHIGSPWEGIFLVLQMAVNFYTECSHGTRRTVTQGSRVLACAVAVSDRRRECSAVRPTLKPGLEQAVTSVFSFLPGITLNSL